MRKIIILAALTCSITTPAFAISRYNSMNYSCAQAQALINRERAVIMRYPSQRAPGMTLYDRYVEDGRSCNIGEYAYQDYMPTKDRKDCPVYTCHSSSELDNDDEIVP